MTINLLLVQLLNGAQLGILLFLIAAGLTLVFGVMDFINLAHGVQYMLGAYIAASLRHLGRQFLDRLVLAMPVALLIGLALELLVFRHLYDRDHLSQVLATFGVILTLEEAVRAIWGSAPLNVPQPEGLGGGIQIMPGLLYPVYRLVIIAAGCVLACCCGCWWSARGSACWSAPGPPIRRWSPLSGSMSAVCLPSCSALAPCWPGSPAPWPGRSSPSSPA